MTLQTNSGEPVRIWLHADTEPMLIILKCLLYARAGGHCRLITFPNKRSERNFSRPDSRTSVSIRQCVETIEREIK